MKTKRRSELLPMGAATATASEALAYLEHVDELVASLALDVERQHGATKAPPLFASWVGWRARWLMWRAAARRRLRELVGTVLDGDASGEWDAIEGWHREAARFQRDWVAAGIKVRSTRPTDAGDALSRILDAAPLLLGLGALLWFAAPGLRRRLSGRR